MGDADGVTTVRPEEKLKLFDVFHKLYVTYNKPCIIQMKCNQYKNTKYTYINEFDIEHGQSVQCSSVQCGLEKV